MKVYALPPEIVRRWQWQDPLLRHLTDSILDLIDRPGGRAIDVGCGTGRVSIALAHQGFRVDAFDLEAPVVDQTREIARQCGLAVACAVADVAASPPPFESEAYDLAVCSEVLEHVDDWRLGLENIRCALKPHAALVLTVPNDPAQFSVLDEYAGHRRRFAWADLEAGLGGFRIEQAFTAGFPLTRTVHWLYTRLLLPASGREHAPGDMWRSGSLYARFGAELLYRFARFDDRFRSFRRGTTWVVRARKS